MTYCQHRPARSLHPGRGGRTRLPPRELLASSAQAQPVSRSGATTQTAPTTDRSGCPPSPGRQQPCRAQVTSTTAGSSPTSPAVPTWASTHIAAVQAANPGVVQLLKPGWPGHPDLTDIGWWIERRHHHRHLRPLACCAEERGRLARGLGGLEPKPPVFQQEPHHRQGWPPSAAHGCHTRRSPWLHKKAEHVEGRLFHAEDGATSSPAEVK